MSEELKACPFCGGEALLERGSDHHGKWFNLGCSRHWGAVADPDESCIGGRLFYTETEKDEAEAITAWNTRATDAENQRLRAEVEALREALEKAQNPSWFYHPDYTERCLFSPCEVIDDYYDPEPGKHVFEIECARPLPSIWCAVHCLTDAERDAMDTGERFIVTEHASEEEARAALTRKAPQ